MKEKIFSACKKIAVILIACIMVLGLVPVGILTIRPHTTAAEGEFLRLFPQTEVTVMAQNGQEKSPYLRLPHGVHTVGDRADSYLQFDLQSLLDKKKLAQVQKAALRLTFLPNERTEKTPVRLWLMPSSDWDGEMKYQDRPSPLGEVKLAEWIPNSNTKEAKVVEVDLTAYLQKWIEDKTTKISMHMEGLGNNFGSMFAGSAYEDSLYRPYLKVVTGDATDPDNQDISKVWLEKTALSGDSGKRIFRIGNGTDAYLQFRLKPENIRGAMYRAELQLTPDSQEQTELTVYRIANGDWSEGEILPRGEEQQIFAQPKCSESGTWNLDLTDAVNDAYAKGETAVTLRISGGEEAVSFLQSGKDAPFLKISASDNAEVVAMTEAAIYALDENPSPNKITQKLSESYTTESGVRAQLRWRAQDAVTGADASDFLSEDGQITRPEWFEDGREILATVQISAGKHQRERTYRMTILPEESSNHIGWEFGDYLKVGDSADESYHGAAERNTSVHNRWIGGKGFSYRTMEPGGMLAVHMAVDAEKQNYLTLKIWKPERPNQTLLIENLRDRQAEPILCSFPAEVPAEDGFLYLTYPIPLSQTRGEEFVALRLHMPENPEQEEVSLWNIYGVYTTQTPYFDPLTFAEQGEVFDGKEGTERSAFRKLLRRLYQAAKQPWEDFAQRWNDEEERLAETRASALPKEAEESFAWLEAETPMLVFDDDGDRIAISLREEEQRAEIHRATSYYDTYAESALHKGEQGFVWVDYGKYQVFRNMADEAQPIPWKESGTLAGVYQDLAKNEYYAFLREGQMADDSVLPPDAQLETGAMLMLAENESRVLKRLSKPLEHAEWRVSAINQQSISQISLNRDLEISQITVKNSVSNREETEELRIVCGVYQKGYLAGLSCKRFTVIPGRGEYRVTIPTIQVTKGQTLKIFIEPALQKPRQMEPKLELP